MSAILYVYRPITPGDRYPGVPMRDLTQADLDALPVLARLSVTKPSSPGTRIYVPIGEITETEAERLVREAAEREAKEAAVRAARLIHGFEYDHIVEELPATIAGIVANDPVVATTVTATITPKVDALTPGPGQVIVGRADGIAQVDMGGLLTPTPARPRVILFGTSLEAQNGLGFDTLYTIGTDPTVHNSARGWFNWMTAYLHSRLVLLKNAGVGGNTFAQMRARMQADVLAHSSDWVFMGGPVNDIGSRTAAAIIADCEAMVDAILSAGRRLLILTAAPSTSYDTPGKRTVLATVNAYIRALATTRPGVIVVDAWAELADPATDFPQTGMAIDSVHFSTIGSWRLGLRAAQVFAAAVGGLGSELIKPFRTGGSVISNPTFLGGTGWTPDANVTVTYAGDRATMRYASPAFNDSGIQYFEPMTGGRWATGETVQARATFRWRDLALKAGPNLAPPPMLDVRLRNVDGSFSNYLSGMNVASNQSPANVAWPSEGEITLTTPKAVIPSTVDRMYVKVGWSAIDTGLVEVSNLRVYKVT